jgi:hypothetical protein
VGSLLSAALSWLAVVTVGLAPILVYWLVRVIGQALRRKAPGAPAGNPQPGDTVPVGRRADGGEPEREAPSR